MCRTWKTFSPWFCVRISVIMTARYKFSICGHAVCKFLNAHFPGWIGHTGLVACPHWSPDFTLLDFCMWGYDKGQGIFKTDRIWERIFTTIRNVFHTFMFYILKSAYLYSSRGFFFFNKYIYLFRKLSEIRISTFRKQLDVRIMRVKFRFPTWKRSTFDATLFCVRCTSSATGVHKVGQFFFQIFSHFSWKIRLTSMEAFQ